MQYISDKYYTREFWLTENLSYSRPHFRLEKSARILNRIARHKECDLLDVGCGPAALMPLLDDNIHYFGIDIAIHHPAPYLRELDFLANPIGFDKKRFDIIAAQGIFEYVGGFQDEKFNEIAELLRPDGVFLVSYVNFDHIRRQLYPPYNNIQPCAKFMHSLERVFHVHERIPTSHQWQHREPSSRLMKAVHARVSPNIPFITSAFAVEYFFLCSVNNNCIDRQLTHCLLGTKRIG